MIPARELLHKQGINLRRVQTGNQKTTCPQCSHTRRNSRDPCLSVYVGDGEIRWQCHHCGWKGADDGFERTTPKPVTGTRYRSRTRSHAWREKFAQAWW